MSNVTFEPVVRSRGVYSYAELFTAPGPAAIGATGDNSFRALFGHDWLLEWRAADNRLHLYHELSDGVWVEVTADLPPPFASAMPEGARRVSFCFDQAARILVAYELEGFVYVTRWDAGSGQYVQNVTFAGTDACLFNDAALVDPAISPDAAVRAAHAAGMRLAYEWLPSGQWLENPVVDSDVVVFYLSPDRTELRARVQRQLYATEHVLHTFDEPAILDRVVALFGRYQALVSDAYGEPLANVLISDTYFTDVMPVYPADERLGAGVAPENLRAVSEMHAASLVELVPSHVAPESLVVVGVLYPAADSDELDASVQPENLAAVGNVYPTTDDDALDAGVQPEDIEARVMDIPASDEDGLTGGITVESIRVQTV